MRVGILLVGLLAIGCGLPAGAAPRERRFAGACPQPVGPQLTLEALVAPDRFALVSDNWLVVDDPAPRWEGGRYVPSPQARGLHADKLRGVELWDRGDALELRPAAPAATDAALRWVFICTPSPLDPRVVLARR